MKRRGGGRGGRGKRSLPASSSTPKLSAESKRNTTTALKPRANRRNELHNITNTKSDENTGANDDSVPVAESSASNDKPLTHIDSADEDEQDADVFKRPESTGMLTSKRSQLATSSTPPSSPSKKRRADSTTVEDHEAELAMFHSIREILSKHYFDVVTRLQLQFQPSCITNLEYCAEFHNTTGDQSNAIDEYLVKDARNFVSEDRPLEFLQFVAKMSIQNEFPGKILLLTLLELILTVNQPSHDKYTSTYIVHTANKLFEDIVNNFPPCWQSVAESYKKLLNHKLHISLDKNKYDASIGIVKVVLNMLEIVLMEEDIVDEDDLHTSEFDETMNSSMWETKRRQTYSFDSLRRDDKIERIFVVLSLLITLMESDLAIWIIRHPKHMGTTMSKPKKMPLIGYFLWPAEQCGHINSLIKQILKLFVISISIGMPTEKVDILARFVSLVANAINLCELQSDKNITFPIIKSHSQIFAQEVKKTIENVQTCNVDLILAVIDHIRAPFIQILVIDQLLMKFNRDVGKPSMKKLYQNFIKKRWTECDEDGSRKIFLHIPADSTSPQYPVYRPLTQKSKLSDIYQQDYLHLLLSSFRAYQLLYQVDAVVRANEPDGVATPVPSMSAEEHTRKLESDNKKQQKFNFVNMERDIEKLEGKLERIAKVLAIYDPRTVCRMDDILVDSETVLRYRDDIKYYLGLRELIGKYYEEYGEIFAKWNDAIKAKRV